MEDSSPILALLKGLSHHQLTELSRILLGAKAPRRKSRIDQLREIQKSDASGSDVFEAYLALYSTDAADYREDRPLLVHRTSSLYGPLGALKVESPQERSPGAVGEVLTLLLDVVPRNSLQRVAERCAGQHAPDLLRRVKALSKEMQAYGLAQACLTAEDDAIARAVNQVVIAEDKSALEVPEHEGLALSSWSVTPWGVVVLPRETEWQKRFANYCDSEDSAFALAMLLERAGGRLLASKIADHRAPDSLTKVSELVLQEGPAALVDRFVSDATLWEWLNEWQLVPPPDASREELLAVVFRRIGLHYVNRPEGLHSLKRDVRRDLEAPECTMDRAMNALRAFESGLETLYLAYIAFCLGEDDNISSLRAENGLEPLCEMGLVVDGKPLSQERDRTLRKMPFGKKRALFAAFLDRIEQDTELKDRLGGTGRSVKVLRRLVGEEVGGVMMLRNRLAHPKGGQAPTSKEILSAIEAALISTIGDGDDLTTPVARTVRVLEVVTDACGWSRFTVEDELGRQFRASSLDYRFDSDRHHVLFQTSNPVAVNPAFVPV